MRSDLANLLSRDPPALLVCVPLVLCAEREAMERILSLNRQQLAIYRRCLEGVTFKGSAAQPLASLQSAHAHPHQALHTLDDAPVSHMQQFPTYRSASGGQPGAFDASDAFSASAARHASCAPPHLAADEGQQHAETNHACQPERQTPTPPIVGNQPEVHVDADLSPP